MWAFVVIYRGQSARLGSVADSWNRLDAMWEAIIHVLAKVDGISMDNDVWTDEANSFCEVINAIPFSPEV